MKKAFLPGRRQVVWMHCASLGEYEQGLPLLTRLKEKYPDAVFLVSFFSPSGYEIVKKKGIFEHVYYLPMDSMAHARRWMDIVNPSLVIWVKYEYWYYYLKEINKRNVPLLLVSGVFQRGQPFFKWYGGLYREMLGCFSHFFVQNISSFRYLSTIVSKEKITVSGDTRCDRVMEIRKNFEQVEGIADFCGTRKVVVAGSTWEDDEAIWTHYVKSHPEYRFIIAPHEIDNDNLMQVKKMFAGACLYTEWLRGMSTASANCLIIDNIGMLSRLYFYATIAYVGGGFGSDGLHNILEPAVYGKPVLFGPAIHKNFEAKDLIDCSGAISIISALHLEEEVNLLMADEAELHRRGNAAAQYVRDHSGATDAILQKIEADYPLNK